jgi:hypothetical protein
MTGKLVSSAAIVAVIAAGIVATFTLVRMVDVTLRPLRSLRVARQWNECGDRVVDAGRAGGSARKKPRPATALLPPKQRACR